MARIGLVEPVFYLCSIFAVALVIVFKKRIEETMKHRAAEERSAGESTLKCEEHTDTAMQVSYPKSMQKFFFEHGLPQLCEQGQKSSSTAEPNARMITYPFVSVVDGVFTPSNASFTCRIPSIIRMSSDQGAGLRWCSEAGLRDFVKLVITDAIAAGQLQGSLTALMEMTITNMKMLKDFIPNLRGNAVVVSLHDYPVGIVVVKMRHRKIGLCDAKHWKPLYTQMHVYMRCLRDYFGVRPVFGIVTTYEEWRVCWLHGAIAHCGDPTSMSSVPNSEAEISRFFEQTPLLDKTSTAKFIHQLTTGVNAQAPITDNILYVSDVYPFNHRNLPVVLTTATMLMASSAVCPSFLTSTRERSFIKISDAEKSWISGAGLTPALKPMPECVLSKPPSTHCAFYLVADMHGGAHGSVWLARTCDGTLHVLKFPVPSDLGERAQSDPSLRNRKQRKERRKLRDAEYDAWRHAYPLLCDAGYISVRDLAAGPALVMPLFGHVSKARRLDTQVREIVKEDIARLAGTGLYHRDVSWRLVGLYRDHGRLCCVLFDLAAVRYSPTPINPGKMLARLGL